MQVAHLGLVSSITRESEPVGDWRWPRVELCQDTQQMELVFPEAGPW